MDNKLKVRINEIHDVFNDCYESVDELRKSVDMCIDYCKKIIKDDINILEGKNNGK